MDKSKILIVEDDEFVAKQMKWALATDYDVLIAEDRLSAMGLFKKEQPSIVTLDLGLPEQNIGCALDPWLFEQGSTQNRLVLFEVPLQRGLWRLRRRLAGGEGGPD